MGHKVPPYALRIGINRNWRSRWFFSKKTAVFLEADYLIRKTIDELFPKAGIIDVIIERKSLDHCRVDVFSVKPGVIIGKDGQNLKKLYKKIEKVLKPLFQRHNLTYPTLEINVVEIKKPNLYAAYLAEQAALQIEKGGRVRTVLKNIVEKAKNTKEIQGIKIKASGRLDGATIHRHETVSWGKIPLSKLIADIDYASKIAFTKYGIIGIKVWLYRGDKIGYFDNVTA